MSIENKTSLSVLEQIVLVSTLAISICSIILSVKSYNISDKLYHNEYDENIMIFQEPKHHNKYTNIIFGAGMGDYQERPYAFFIEYKVTLVNKRSQPVTVISCRLMPSESLTSRSTGVFYSKIFDTDLPFDIPGNGSKAILVRLYHPIGPKYIDLDKLKHLKPNTNYELANVLYLLEDYGKTFMSGSRIMPDYKGSFKDSEVNVGNNYPDIGDSIHNFEIILTSAENNTYSKELLCYY